MYSVKRIKIISAVVIAILLLVAAFANQAVSQNTATAKVSRFGEYSGYSKQAFDGYQRQSRYVPVRDGTRLAVDIYHPTKQGELTDQKLPVLVWSTWYKRATVNPDGSVGLPILRIDQSDSQARYFLEHGYVIVAIDVRGSGASFGATPPDNQIFPVYGQDNHDIIEWAAKEPWSTGAVGMFGNSFMGHTQVAAAAAHPPSLKAILPGSHAFFGWPETGGAIPKTSIDYRIAMGKLNDSVTDQNVQALKEGEGTSGQRIEATFSKLSVVAPVDGPQGEALLKEAIAEHKKTGSMMSAARSREQIIAGVIKQLGSGDYIEALYQSLGQPAIESNIPIYSIGGHFDWYASTPLLWFKNWQGPKKAVIGPWTHAPDEVNDPKADAHNRAMTVEGLRWFDYWLKGIENGVMDESPIHFAVIDKDSNRGTWLNSSTWPMDRVERKTFYLDIKPQGDQVLSDRIGRQDQQAALMVDYSVTTGPTTRYGDSSGSSPLHYPELSEANSKGLVYTSAVLEKDIAVVGAPVIELNLTGTAADALVVVILEKVLPDGQSIFVSDGKLQASWRALSPAPFNTLGLPYASGSKKLVDSMPPLHAGPTTMTFNLKSTGMVFEKGSRIRLLITGADAENYYQQAITPAPALTVFSGPTLTSQLSLPLLDTLDAMAFGDW